MKKYIFSLMLIAAFGSNAAAFAQSEIVVGDMNDDGQLTVGDVTALSETVIGHKAVRRISVAGDPYAADNTIIVGQWTGISGTITFNADGTTDYKDGYTYRYLPTQCMIVFYNSDSAAVECLEVVELGTNILVLANPSLSSFLTYGLRMCYADDGSMYYLDNEGHGYVDLGLPSGTLWATYNIGAASPENCGDRFAWGEVEPKETYDWSNYKYCEGSDRTLTKYCTDSAFGTVDGKVELDPEDDAAYVIWGNEWRMPSSDQLTELKRKCIWTWNAERHGYDIVGPNNNKILLTASDDNETDYWTRTTTSYYPCWAIRLYFYSDSIGDIWNEQRRGNGHYIRPVRATPVSRK